MSSNSIGKDTFNATGSSILPILSLRASVISPECGNFGALIGFGNLIGLVVPGASAKQVACINGEASGVGRDGEASSRNAFASRTRLTEGLDDDEPAFPVLSLLIFSYSFIIHLNVFNGVPSMFNST